MILSIPTVLHITHQFREDAFELTSLPGVVVAVMVVVVLAASLMIFNENARITRVACGCIFMERRATICAT